MYVSAVSVLAAVFTNVAARTAAIAAAAGDPSWNSVGWPCTKSLAYCIPLTYSLMPAWKNFRSLATMLRNLPFHNLLRHQHRPGLRTSHLNDQLLHTDHGTSTGLLVLRHHKLAKWTVRISHLVHVDNPWLQMQSVVLQKLSVRDAHRMATWKVDHETSWLLDHLRFHFVLITSLAVRICLLDKLHDVLFTSDSTLKLTHDKGQSCAIHACGNHTQLLFDSNKRRIHRQLVRYACVR